MASEMRTIKCGDLDWKVTAFHCVVGPIARERNWGIGAEWARNLGALGLQTWNGFLSPDPTHMRNDYIYPTEWPSVVAAWRQPNQYRPVGCWVLNYTNNPLILNEYEPEEVTLACEDNGLVLINFADLPGIQDALKVYQLGEFWVCYAEGGTERALRGGGPRKDSLR